MSAIRDMLAQAFKETHPALAAYLATMRGYGVPKRQLLRMIDEEIGKQATVYDPQRGQLTRGMIEAFLDTLEREAQ